MNSERFFEVLTPIATLLIGWFLSTFTSMWQSRRENRKALSKAIADLLEIRFRLLVEEALMKELKNLVPLSPNDEREARTMLLQVLPSTGDVSKRYDDTVTLI